MALDRFVIEIEVAVLGGLVQARAIAQSLVDDRGSLVAEVKIVDEAGTEISAGRVDSQGNWEMEFSDEQLTTRIETGTMAT